MGIVRYASAAPALRLGRCVRYPFPPPAGPEFVLASNGVTGWGHRIYRTRDGRRWHETILPTSCPVSGLAHFGGKVLCLGREANAFADASIYRSADGAKTWGIVFEDAALQSVAGLCYSRNNLAVACGVKSPVSRLLYSSDAGETWSDIGEAPDLLWCMASAGDGVLCAGAYNSTDAIHRSTDDGLNWSVVRTVASGSNKMLSIAYLGGSHWIATGSITMLSSDHGLTWQDATTVIGGLQLYPVTGANVLLASDSGTNRGIYRSTNYGDTWARTYNAYVAGVHTYAVAANKAGRALAVTSAVNGPCPRSRDGGQTWIERGAMPKSLGVLTWLECLRPERVL